MRAVAGGALNLVGAAFERRKRGAGPRHHLGLHEADDVGLGALLASRRYRVVVGVAEGGRRAVQSDDDGEGGDDQRDDAAERTAEIECRGARFPRQRRADGVGIARRAWIAGKELEQRGELRAAPTACRQTAPAALALCTTIVDVPSSRSTRDSAR